MTPEPQHPTAQPVFNIPHAEKLRLHNFGVRYPIVASALLSAFKDRRALQTYALEVASLIPVTSESDHADELARALNEGFEGEWDVNDQSHQLPVGEAEEWQSLFQK